MHEHYYSSKPTAKSEEREIQAKLLDQSLVFYTDRGVFSKKGVDFGSRLLIETVSIEHERVILDLGCGYGPIGIAMAKAYPQLSVVMLDINERAVELAKKNVVRNQVSNRIELLVSDGFFAVSERRFDAILFNPPIRIGKSAVYALFAQSREHLESGGKLWVVIRKQQGAASAKAELERIFDQVDVVEQKKGYWIIRAAVR
ncbi:class I SAM-dependent methyltransferase [Thermoflavimicrobium dichotomicum]|uniref:16S rRNA (Guanine1207-N2)-methyltransferase n=1 Tax=Thermoflavimicrobium dichotomicum TaxID=46223 RepID=A0A1I3QVV0_9BACL|nr:class I SAM-dependent methyltransferase [Thermoflavimicrobium dichotomicum]SFJ37629.1 16S rRNA (guanine1207-N2)-methyltransferase [Thermoflavimicrobium dichotomicum]